MLNNSKTLHIYTFKKNDRLARCACLQDRAASACDTAAEKKKPN